MEQSISENRLMAILAICLQPLNITAHLGLWLSFDMFEEFDTFLVILTFTIAIGSLSFALLAKSHLEKVYKFRLVENYYKVGDSNYYFISPLKEQHTTTYLIWLGLRCNIELPLYLLYIPFCALRYVILSLQSKTQSVLDTSSDIMNEGIETLYNDKHKEALRQKEQNEAEINTTL